MDKFLADAGIGTRSEVKKLIQKGQVQLDGAPARRPEQKVIPGESVVAVQGEPVGPPPEFEYWLLHKPAGYVSATEDPREKTVMELIPSRRKGLFPAGRLDKDTEGLLLITNDGLLAHQLLSPGKHVEKTYEALVRGIVTEEDAEALGRGVEIGEKRPALPARLELLEVLPGAVSAAEEGKDDGGSGEALSRIRLTICEGKFHQVKRMMEAVGKKVLYLKRISMGPLVLPEDLQKGDCRPLSQEEIEMLRGFRQ